MSSPAGPLAPPAPVPTTRPAAAPPRPSIGVLFLAFAAISLSGFGGVLAWARRIMVERRRWFTAKQFNEAFALCAFLPGGNMINFALIFGARMRGPPGALAAVAGLLGPPMILFCGRRRQRRYSGNAPLCGRCSTLAERSAVRRFVRTGATHAGTEPDHCHLDRLSRRRHCRRAGGDLGDVRPAIGARVFRRASERFIGAPWHGALSRGLMPVMIGLTAASATVIVSVADYSWVAAAITLATAAIALFMRVHPLWAFAAAALLGLAGLV
jgi:chromate transport protein ChrA